MTIEVESGSSLILQDEGKEDLTDFFDVFDEDVFDKFLVTKRGELERRRRRNDYIYG